MSRFTPLGNGLYKDTSGRFYHRPVINSARTWRVLDVATLTQARALKSSLDSNQTLAENGLAKDPYGLDGSAVGTLIEKYKAAGCPTKANQPRTGTQLEQELSRLAFLEPFWKLRKSDQVKPKDCFAYVEQRKKSVRKGFTGGRACDMELSTLASVFNWAFYTGIIDQNPLATRPKFRDRKAIRHCRDVMPNNATELHSLAAALFEDPRSESLGWQVLLEAMTGCRTNEVLRLRWDAANRSQAGFIEQGHLWLQRSKNGVNPFCEIHPALEETLQALRQWRAWRELTDNPYFLPTLRETGKGHPVSDSALTQALARVAPVVLGRKVISHGLRAYFVTVRRSMGIADVQIAGEIGDVSGASLIVSTYGAIPANWRGGAGLGWTVEKPAWAVLGMPENLLPMQASKSAVQ